MEGVVDTVITAVATGAISYAFWLLKENRNIKLRLKEKDAEKAEALKAQREQMLADSDRRQSLELKMLEELHIADIKQKLYDMHRKYYIGKGYMPGFLKETLQAYFKYYHAHGGNGHGEHMYNDLMSLPEEDPQEC